MYRAVLLVAGLSALSSASAAKLEIFSWWAGDEAPALRALLRLYQQKYPDVSVNNATVSGGAGTNAKAVLKTRMLGGTPPDSFQAHAGQELIGTWVVANRMEDLSSLFKSEGWTKAFPADVVKLISSKGGIWSVPVNVHRSNVMWYNPAKLKAWDVTPPKTWAEFLTTCNTLKAKGVAAPLVVGENWTQQHLWENVMVGSLGADGWQNLWSGKTKFTDPKVVAAFTTFGKVMDCANKDAASLSWQQASDRIADGTSAFNIMGDWAAGYLTNSRYLLPNTGFGWTTAPGTDGTFVMLADSFGLPKGAKHRTEAVNWLKVLGSRQGQDTFNPLKGSIAARLDSDIRRYNTYSRSAAADWKKDRIVGSMAHGAVAPESFTSAFGAVIDQFVASKNAQSAAAAAQQLADKAGLGR
ncbi:ABC transporter substrate-binding protein [Deinococcus sp. Leaf326]|jgi:glucose/mannose transport system substrate-binding protein|uniref:ABC transporter substrate-binding protein n=1 Tax=Deinococcus sp. Leaf326 TaxID=1736338 RepID=UPI0006FB32EE|nr:extracellular solute-binding protein [Deinococcus sp. Leaf326]KQR01022.1 ABC transporter substrate-binding protein [Deinococcus sp. Leaf326]